MEEVRLLFQYISLEFLFYEEVIKKVKCKRNGIEWCLQNNGTLQLELLQIAILAFEYNSDKLKLFKWMLDILTNDNSVAYFAPIAFYSGLLNCVKKKVYNMANSFVTDIGLMIELWKMLAIDYKNTMHVDKDDCDNLILLFENVGYVCSLLHPEDEFVVSSKKLFGYIHSFIKRSCQMHDCMDSYAKQMKDFDHLYDDLYPNLDVSELRRNGNENDYIVSENELEANRMKLMWE